MILLFLGIDLIIYQLTFFKTYFFLSFFPFAKKKHLPLIIVSSLILDLLYFNTFPIHLIIFIGLYFLNQWLFRKKDILNYILLMVLNYIVYVSLTYILMNYQNLEIFYLLKFIGLNIWISIIFYLLIFYQKKLKK